MLTKLCLQAVVTTAHAYGELRHHPEDTALAAFEDHAQQFVDDYTCAHWSTVLQAFTRVYARPQTMWTTLYTQVGCVCCGLRSALVSASWQTYDGCPLLQGGQAGSL